MLISIFMLATVGYLIWLYRKAVDRERNVRPLRIPLRDNRRRLHPIAGGERW
jgi:hypothetical protein